MPRGRRPIPKTLEEQISLYQTQIEEHKLAIEKLKSQIKNAKLTKKKQEAERLMEAIEASGKTVQEVLAEIQGEK